MSEPRFLRPTMTYAGYIFDCDGTLVDTMPLHFRAWRKALEQAAFPFTWDLFLSRAGMSLEQTIVELNDQFGAQLTPSDVAEAQRRFYRELEREVLPIPEVVEFVRDLAEEGQPIAVASGSSRPTVESALRQIGIFERIGVIVTPESVPRGKPFPDMFLLAAELLGVEPTRCLVIEDGEMGIEAARRAHMDCAIVRAPRPNDA